MLSILSFKKIIRFFVVICIFGQVILLRAIPDDENDQQDLSLVSTLSPFSHHIVPLKFESINNVPVVFDDQKMMSIVDYQLDGASIGHLINTDEGMYFRSHDPRYRFLLKRPLKTGKFFIDIEGEFTFQASVKSRASSFKGRSMEFARDISFISDEDSVFNKVDYVSLAKRSRLDVGGNLLADVKDLDFQGDCKAGNFAIFNVSNNAALNGSLRSPIISMDSQGKITCNSQATFSVDQYLGLKAKHDIEFAGNAIQEWSLENHPDETFDRGIFLQSHRGDVKDTGSVTAKNGDITLLAHNYVTHKGKSNASENTLMRSKFLTNSGSIDSKKMYLKADRSFLNFGYITADSTAEFDALIALNVFGGQINAKTLISRAGIDCNFLGLYRVQNAHTTSLIGCNAGLFLPQFNSYSDFITRDNLYKVGSSLFFKLAPGYMNAVYGMGRILYNIPAICYQTYDLCRQARLLSTHPDVGVSDLIPLICGAKDVVLQANNALGQTVPLAQSGWKSLGSPRDFKDLRNCAASKCFQDMQDFDISSSLKSIDIKKHLLERPAHPLNPFETALGSVEAIGPSANKNALLSVNIGIDAGISGQSSSVWHINGGASLFAGIHAINTIHGDNWGKLGAGALSVYAHENFYSSGKWANLFGIQGSVSAKNLETAGKMNFARKLILKAQDKADIKSKMRVGGVDVQAPDVLLHGDCAIDADDAVNLIGDRVITEADIRAKEGLVDAKNIKAGGTIDCDGKLGMRAQEKADIKSKMRVGGVDVQAPDVLLRSDCEIDATHTANISGHQVTTGASIHSKDAHVMGKYVKTTSSSHIDAATLINAEERLHDKGSYSGPMLFEKAKNIKTTESSHVATESAYIKATDTLEDQRKYDVKQDLFLEAKDIFLKKTSDISAGNAQIKAQGILKKTGSMKVKNTLTMRGKYLTNLGPTIARNAQMNSDRVWANINLANARQKLAKIPSTIYGAAVGVAHATREALVSIPENVANLPSATRDATVYVAQATGGVLASIPHAVTAAGGAVYDFVPPRDALPTWEELWNSNGSVDIQENLTINAGLSLNLGGQISAENAQIHADYWWLNVGSVKAAESLSLRSNHVTNFWEITAENSRINADRCWLNFGSIAVRENLNIDAGISLNVGGKISATNLTTNSLIDLDLLGTYDVQNSKTNAIVGLNTGLLISRVKKLDWDQIATRDNAIALAKIAALTATAKISYPAYLGLKGVDLIYRYRDGGVFRKFPVLFNEGSALKCNGDAGLSDWVPLMCQAKDVGLSIAGDAVIVAEIGSAGYHRYYPEKIEVPATATSDSPAAESSSNTPPAQSSTVTETSANTEPAAAKGAPIKSASVDNRTCLEKIADKCINQDFKSKPLSESSWEIAQETAKGAFAAFGPNVSRDVLFDFNFGTALGVNSQSHCLYNVHGGRSLFANNYSLQTYNGANLGTIAAANVAISAAKRYASTSKIYGVSGSITADELDIKDKICMIDRASLQARVLNNQGTIEGSCAIKFTGNAEDLKSIGKINTKGGAFHYQGAIRQDGEVNNLPSADELADGSGQWGSIANQRAITFDAGKQTVTFKQAHDMQHALNARTEGALTAHQPLSSQQDLDLHAGKTLQHVSLKAGGNVTRTSGESIVVESTVERTKDGANYSDQLDQVSITAGGASVAHAKDNIVQAGVKTHSGKGGTHYIAGGVIKDKSLALENHQENHHAIEGSERLTHFTQSKPAVPEHSSEGAFIMQAGNKYESDAPKIDSKQILLQGKTGGVIINEVHYGSSYSEDYKKEGGWITSAENSHGERQIAVSVGAKLTSDSAPQMISDSHVSLTNVSVHAPKLIIDATVADIKLGTNSDVSSHASKSRGWIWNSNEERTHKNETFSVPNMPGTIESRAQETRVEAIRNQTLDFAQRITHDNGILAHDWMDESRICINDSEHKLTPQATAVLVLATSMATGGIASSVGAGTATILGCQTGSTAAHIIANMTSAALSSASTHAALALAENCGDITKAAESLARQETFRSMALSACTAGLMIGADRGLSALGISKLHEANSFGMRLASAGSRELVRAGMRTGVDTLAGAPADRSWMKNIRLALAGTLATVGAAQVGNAYGNGDINPLTHKILHAAVGATSGALIDGRNGALAGGLGAFTSELAAELFCPDKLSIMQSAHELEVTKGRLLTQEEFTNHYWQKVHTAQGNAQLLAAATAFVARQDVDIAHFTSSAALENNFLVLAAYGATAASAAYSAYCIGNAYKQEGIEGALNQLGIEIAINAAGWAGGKMIFKAAGKVYPTALIALDAVLENNPALRKSIGGSLDVLRSAAGKLSESSLGKAVTRAETAILNAESKVAQQFAAIGKSKGAERIAQRSAAELKDVIPLVEKNGEFFADLSALSGGSSRGLMVMSQQFALQSPMVIHAPLSQALARFGTPIATQAARSAMVGAIEQPAITDSSGVVTLLENPAHNVNQYGKLKANFQYEEITGIKEIVEPSTASCEIIEKFSYEGSKKSRFESKLDLLNVSNDVVPLDRLEYMMERYHKVPGFTGKKDAVLERVLDVGALENKAGQWVAKDLDSAKGTLFEIEAAIKLEAQHGMEITEFGAKYMPKNIVLAKGKDALDFDLATNKILIECKNRNLDPIAKDTEKLDKFLEAIINHKKTAEEVANKEYLFVSGKPLPEQLQEALKLNKIDFLELL